MPSEPVRFPDQCPDSRLWDQLVTGDLSPDWESKLLKHLDHCPACQEAIEQLASKQPISKAVGELRIRNEHSQLLVDSLGRIKSDQNPWSRTPEAPSTAAAEHPDALKWTEDGFELIRLIGCGGMAFVYLARERSLDRMVAIKVLTPHFGAQPLARERFLREAKAGAAIKHPHVVAIHAIADSPSSPYLVMEFVDGGSLQEQMDQSGPLQINEVARLGAQAAAGLAAAHEQGIIHRDIKPLNLLIEAQTGSIKLGDFGLALVAGNSQLTQTGTVLGTPSFMAPECLDESFPPDHRSDLFSLGSVLYAMCTGVSPFEASSTMATLHRVANVSTTPIRNHRDDVPVWLETIITKLLQKDPSRRFQSALEVADALNAGATTTVMNHPGLLTLETRRKPVRKKIKRQVAFRGFWILLGICIMVLLVGLAGKFPLPWSSSGEFVVLDEAGQTIDSFESLAQAIEAADDDSRIEILTSRTIELEGIFLEQHRITIAAAERFHPSIHFVPGDEEDRDAMLSSEGELRIEGVDLRFASEEEEENNRFLVSAAGGFFADGCRLIAGLEGGCVLVDGAGTMELSNCQLHAPKGSALEMNFDHPSQVILDNCLITGGVGLQVETNEGWQLTMRHCTVVASRILSLPLMESSASALVQTEVTATQCIFQSQGGLVWTNTPDASLVTLTNHLAWSGENNVFSGPFVGVGDGDEETSRVPSWGRDFDQWNTITNNIASQVSSPIFLMQDHELWEQVFDEEVELADFQPRDLSLNVGVRMELLSR